MVKENTVKHLEFVQNVITRMANNSFLLKGWTITLVAALFALAAQNSNLNFVYLAIFPIAAFWILDAYYLRQEKLYRALYDSIRIKDKNTIQSEGPFSMDATSFEKSEPCQLQVMFSKTLLLFYSASIITVGIVILIIKFKI